MCNLRHYANCNFRKPQYNVPIVSCFLFNEILFTTLRLIITHHIHHLHTQKSAVFSRHSLIFVIASLKYPHLFKYMHFSNTQGLHCSFLSLRRDDTGLPECRGESFWALKARVNSTFKKNPMEPAHIPVTSAVINNNYFAALSSCPENHSKLWLLFGHLSGFSWCFSCRFCSFTSAVVNLSTYFSVPVSSSPPRRWCDSAMSHESLGYHVLSCSSREDSACQKPLWFVPSHWCLSVCGVFLASN